MYNLRLKVELVSGNMYLRQSIADAIELATKLKMFVELYDGSRYIILEEESDIDAKVAEWEEQP